MVVLPDPAAREKVVRENEADPLAGEQTWPTDMVRSWKLASHRNGVRTKAALPNVVLGTSDLASG